MMARVFVLLLSLHFGIIYGQELCETDLRYEWFIKNVLENTKIGTEIGHIPIYGNESEISLTQEDNDFFLFDSRTRNVTLIAELDSDRNAPPIPELRLRCKKRNVENAREVEISVKVLVLDWNDNRPTFSREFHNISIPEDALIGTTVYSSATATDNDKEYTGNSRIVYEIHPGDEFSDYFTIAVPTRPDVTLVRELDYEAIKVMVIRIEATDAPSQNYGPKLTGTATLTINILDADDQNPEFSSKTYRGVIKEDAQPGTVVNILPRIYARDPDSMNVSVVYRLLDPYELFEIDPITAVVRNVKPLYVDVPTVTVVVLASQVDDEDREWFALLTISITEANINAPRFSQSLYEVTKTELEPVGSTLVVTTATDIDFQTVTGTVINYSLVDAGDDLIIDENGGIILQRPLDYEMEQERIVLVTASDGSHTATATVKIRIIDVNDNNPVLVTGGKTEFNVPREQGKLVTVLSATDGDVESTLIFQLRNFQDLFAINSVGEISIKAPPGRLTNDQYHLLVAVVDDEESPRQDVTQITVNFPPLGGRPITTTAGTEVVGASVLPAQDNMLTIIFGAVAGLLLVIIVILVVYILWRNKRVKEELDRARAPKGFAAKGLTYRQAESPDDIPNIYGQPDDTDGISDFDGGTSVQNNPLKDSEVNQGYLQSSGSEMDRDLSEIEVETAVVPYGDDEYEFPSRNKYSGQMRTFQGDDTASSGSSDGQSDSTGGSRRVLVNEQNKNSGSKMTSWDSDDKIHPQGSEKLLDPGLIAPPRTKKERPEITVYF